MVFMWSWVFHYTPREASAIAIGLTLPTKETILLLWPVQLTAGSRPCANEQRQMSVMCCLPAGQTTSPISNSTRLYLKPTVKLTMHSISIRQENDPWSPRFSSVKNLQRCAKKQTIEVKAVLYNTSGSTAFNAGVGFFLFVLWNFVWKYEFTENLFFTAPRVAF